jgi:hypothetical protein
VKRKSATVRSFTCRKLIGYPVVVKNILPFKATAFLAVLFLFSSGINKDTVDTSKPSDFYHFNKNRVAAEWEPAKGVIFMCPPVIPKELIIEFARDTHLYPVGLDDHDLSIRL